MITQGPAFEPLSTPETTAYTGFMRKLGLEHAGLQEARGFGAVEDAAARFMVWTAMNGLTPDFQRTTEIALMENGALHPHPQVGSEWAMRHPHETVTSKVARRIMRRPAPHPHQGFEVPAYHQTVIDMDLWGISEHHHGVKGVQQSYEKKSQWLVGKTLPTPLSALDEVHLYDNWEGRVKLTFPRTVLDAAGNSVPITNPEVPVNGQLHRLRRLEGPSALPSTFSAAHIANRAARLAAQHGLTTTGF